MYKYFFKRVLDIFLSFTAIVLLSPFFLIICTVLLLTGEHYIFYLQKRIGYNNREFKIIKFATMLKNSPNIGSGVYTAKNDNRILPMGSFLRKTKINEFPQLLNVLIGDMSIIGPRPLVKKTYNFYPEQIRDRIGSVKPGISGVQQIIFRNEDEMLNNAGSINLEEYYKKNISPYKGRLENWYSNNISFCNDILIILLTIFSVINRQSTLIFKVFKDLPKK